MIVEVSGIPVYVTRKYIKNIYMRVKTPEGHVEVSAPIFISEKEIISFVESKKDWLEKKLKKNGDQALPNASMSVVEMKKVLGRRLDVLVPKWESITGLHPAGYKMRAMRTRWGTCNIRTRMLCFSTMLYDKPDEFVEYVVLHELAHLKVANHGADFKALLTFYMPNWRVVRKMGN